MDRDWLWERLLAANSDELQAGPSLAQSAFADDRTSARRMGPTDYGAILLVLRLVSAELWETGLKGMVAAV